MNFFRSAVRLFRSIRAMLQLNGVFANELDAAVFIEKLGPSIEDLPFRDGCCYACVSIPRLTILLQN